MSIKMGVVVLLDPKEIVIDKNSRWDGEPLDPIKVEEMYLDIKQRGQLVPVRVRKDGDRLVLVFGFHRVAAILLHNERHPDSPLKVKAIASSMNAESALLESISENRIRARTSPMDDSFAQKRLREEFGWTDARIADHYHVSAGMVSKLKTLLSLPFDLQKQLHARDITLNAALDLASVSEKDRAEILKGVDESEKEEEKRVLPDPVESVNVEANGAASAEPAAKKKASVRSKRIASAVRNHKIDKGGAKSRTLSEFRNWLTSVAEKSEGERKDLCKLLLKFLAGGIKDETAEKKLAELVK